MKKTVAKMKRKRVENDATSYRNNSTIGSPYGSVATRRQRQTKIQKPSVEAAEGDVGGMRLDEGIKLNIHYDFGTSKAAMSWAEVSEGSRDPAKVQIQDVLVDDNTFRIPTLVAVVPDSERPEQLARLCFGNDVEQGLQIRAIDKKHVWMRIKQSSVFVDLNDNSEYMSRTQKDELKTVQEAHQKTLDIVKKFERVVASFDWDEEDEEVSLRTMEDVVQCFLKYLLLKTKTKLSSVLALNKIEFEQLFRKSWNIGIAVPDLWSPETRNVLYSLLVTRGGPHQNLKDCLDVGFPEGCQITSESKSAAAMLLKNRLEKALNLPKTERDDKLERIRNTTFVNVDIGAGTVDISTLRLQIFGFNNAEDRTQINSKLVSVIDSRSCRDGGDSVNEAMMRHLRNILRPKLRDIKTAVLEEYMSDEDFMDYFAPGIEKAKKGFGDNRSSVYRRIAYSGPGKLPELKFQLKFPFYGESVRVSGTTVDVPDSLWQQCFNDQLEALLRHGGILDQ